MPDLSTGAIVTLLVLATMLGVAMSAPIHVRLAVVVAPGRSRGRVRVRWLGITWRSPGPRRRRPPARASPEPAARPAVKKGRTGRRVRAILTRRAFRRRVVRLVVDLLRVLTPLHLWIHARVGLGDPAATGIVYGVLRAAESGWRSRAAACRMVLAPDFLEPGLTGRGVMEWRAAPAQLLWPITTFLVSPATWGALVAAYRAG